MATRRLGELEQTLLFAVLALSGERDADDDPEADDEGAHGVAIRRLIERETGKAPSPGALHTGYDRLEKRGLVTSRLGDPSPVRGGRPKRLYTLTAKGARELRSSFQRLSALANGRLELLDEIADPKSS